ncbi:hypothetical protein TGVEG_289020 [Toxoplasma gondii VEG]|uniref:Uncharacterized protein n=3 Tax=Toxoplasma gondii TaxID=5811 RepID=V4Z0D6_TOXGV|nr:hypothetical protein TGVEG_289020 [Toxoplasma gondii VEG]KFG32987.1 hypothetical protein TGP89_289020 [Toxoplasma gondii p89]
MRVHRTRAHATKQETLKNSREAEIRDLSQQARAAKAEARETQRRMQEQADAFSQKIQQMERTSKFKLQEALEALDRQTTLAQTAEAELLRQKNDHEVEVDRITREAEAKIKLLEAEKRRGTEDAVQEVLSLKQEEQRNAEEIETLQEQCQHLAIQHAKSMAKAEQLAKQAEGVQAECERRLSEHQRLLADFRVLEETHRGLLVDMEGLSRSKEDVEATVAELQRQLAEREKRIEQNKVEYKALQDQMKKKEATREENQLQLKRAAAEMAQLKRVVCAKLSSARRKEDKLRKSIQMLVERVNQVMAERNGLWQALLRVKDDYDIHAKQVESQAAARLRLPISTSGSSATDPHAFSTIGHPTTVQIPSYGNLFTTTELKDNQQPMNAPLASLNPFFPFSLDYSGGGTAAGGVKQEGRNRSIDSASVLAPAACGATGMSAWYPSSTSLSLTGEKTDNIISCSPPLDGLQSTQTGGLGLLDSVLGGLNQNSGKGTQFQGRV